MHAVVVLYTADNNRNNKIFITSYNDVIFLFLLRRKSVGKSEKILDSVIINSSSLYFFAF